MILLLSLLLLLCIHVDASEIMDQQADLFGVSDLEKALPSSAKELMGHTGAEDLDFSSGASDIINSAVSKSGGYFRTSLALVMQILVILLLCRLVETGTAVPEGRAVSLAGVLALSVCCAADLRTMIGLGRTTMDEMMSFSTMLLPVVASTAAASGSFTGAGVLYGVTVGFSKLLISFCGNVLLPLIYAFLALGVTDSALQESRLSKLRELLSWLIKGGLKTVMYVFTGFLAISGVLAGNVDAAALKTASVTISGMVPVVGGIISDAAQSVLYSAGVLKSAVGTFGMLAFLAIFIAPFLRMGIQYLAFKMTTALGGILGSKLTGFMECITVTMGFLLAMLASCALMCMMSCFCFLRVVGI